MPVVSPAETVKAPPVTRKLPGRTAYSTPSILDALRNDVSAEKPAESTVIADNRTSYNNKEQPFGEQELVVEWKKFVTTIDAAQLKSALGTREPLLREGWLIEYELDTELQLNRLTLDLKPKLLGYLRTRLNNDAIEIQFKISENTVSKSSVPYTDAEKWASLVEKYPALAMLKAKFGLDFEHF